MTATLRRRRIVVAGTLIVGVVLLGISLSITPGYTSFYVVTLATAEAWTVGGLLSGPIHLGRIASRRPVLVPFLTGLAAGAIFVAGALIVRRIPVLDHYVTDVLSHARYASLPLITVVTVANGVAEEIFFRGALFAALPPRHAVAVSTVVYAVATAATGNPMLVFAALILGVVFGWQRRASGGILAPMITHITWSTLMLYALPPLFPA